MKRAGMVKTLIGVVALSLFTAIDLAAQFQPPGALGALAPANLAKPRPKPPFDLTGTWLHGGGQNNPFQFAPPPGFKLTPEAQVHYDLSLIHISEPTRLLSISYAVF